MVDTPEQAAVRRKAQATIARLQREQNTPAAIAERAERRERIRRDAINQRLEAASAEVAAREARGELTPEQTARHELLNNRWVASSNLSDPEFREMQKLNAIHARKPAPVKPTPRAAAPANGRKKMDAFTKAASEAVAREISEHRRERELQSAKINEALARLDAALARTEAASVKGDRDASQQRFILTRDVS